MSQGLADAKGGRLSSLNSAMSYVAAKQQQQTLRKTRNACPHLSNQKLECECSPDSPTPHGSLRSVRFVGGAASVELGGTDEFCLRKVIVGRALQEQEHKRSVSPWPSQAPCQPRSRGLGSLTGVWMFRVKQEAFFKRIKLMQPRLTETRGKSHNICASCVITRLWLPRLSVGLYQK